MHLLTDQTRTERIAKRILIVLIRSLAITTFLLFGLQHKYDAEKMNFYWMLILIAHYVSASIELSLM
jgi:hypothetical protein